MALHDALVVTHARLGRKTGKGFYDCPAEGPTLLWPGLADLQPAASTPTRWTSRR